MTQKARESRDASMEARETTIALRTEGRQSRKREKKNDI